MENNLKFNVAFETMENNIEVLKVRQYINERATELLIKKQELLEKYIYKQLSTEVLKAMKLNIEVELLDRQLKEAKNG